MGTKWQSIVLNQARRNRRGLGVGLQHPQIFAKVHLLPIDNNSEKKTVAKKNISDFKFLKNDWQHYSGTLHVMHKTNFD